MPIPRCPHGVYSPYGDGQPSEYCTGCTVPIMRITLTLVEEDEPEPVSCPACGELMDVTDEYDLECFSCGFNDLN
jgi:hypothetical protein